MNTIEALKLLIEECERYNATGLREFGMGLIDLNAIAKAKEALAAPVAAELAHPDDLAVDRFAARMKWKLGQKRRQGRSGWQDREWTPEMISQALREHVDKGDPLDVANYCMFLAARNEPIAPAPQPVREPLKKCPTLDGCDTAAGCLGGCRQ